MKKGIKAKWVKALRSGKYIQSASRLRTDRGFCCLGVLCDVIDNTKWVKAPKQNNLLPYYTYDEECSRDFLPISLLKKTGLELKNPHVIVDEKIYELSSLNDDGRYTFNQIADLIEEQL